ncbi:MAG: DNA-processing protein DprA [Clostridia bacterium]
MSFISIIRNWIWLSECIDYTSISNVLERFENPENVYVASEEELRKVISKKECDKILQKDFSKADEILNDCFEKEITVFSINDSMYPDLLRNINNPPLVLYMKGRMPDLDTKVAINIIGTRQATLYGKMVTKKLTHILAKEGVIIVSGMAAGIDTIANKEAILAKTPTIAVLGCSVDYCYPAENRYLMDDIIAVGAVISEYPPTTKPLPMNFPQRNRIMSGLCRGVLVVEAPKKSGTLITASYALEQGRDIFAVPGNIDNPNAQGCNELIKIGAKMVTSPYDVLSEYENELGNKEDRLTVRNEFNVFVVGKEQNKSRAKANNIRKQKSAQVEYENKEEKKLSPPKKRQDMSANESIIYDIIASGADIFDEIIEKSNLSASEVMMTITMLEINGDVTQNENRIKIKEN